MKPWVQVPSTHIKSQVQQGAAVLQNHEGERQWVSEAHCQSVQLNREGPSSAREPASKNKAESHWGRLPVLTPSLLVYHMCTDTRTHVYINIHVLKTIYRLIIKRTWNIKIRSVYVTNKAIKQVFLIWECTAGTCWGVDKGKDSQRVPVTPKAQVRKLGLRELQQFTLRHWKKMNEPGFKPTCLQGQSSCDLLYHKLVLYWVASTRNEIISKAALVTSLKFTVLGTKICRRLCRCIYTIPWCLGWRPIAKLCTGANADAFIQSLGGMVEGPQPSTSRFGTWSQNKISYFLIKTKEHIPHQTTGRQMWSEPQQLTSASGTVQRSQCSQRVPYLLAPSKEMLWDVCPHYLANVIIQCHETVVQKWLDLTPPRSAQLLKRCLVSLLCLNTEQKETLVVPIC